MAMHRKITTISLPRRVAIYHVFFSLVAIVGFTAGLINSQVRQSRLEKERQEFSRLKRTASAVKIDLMARKGQGVQSLVERMAAENDHDYAFLLASDKRFVAHSIKQRIEKRHLESEGRYFNQDGVVGYLYQDANGNWMREIRLPIELPKDQYELRLGSRQATFWTSLPTMDHLVLIVVFPLIPMAVGAICLRRVTRPWVTIEEQLTGVARCNLDRPKIQEETLRSAVSLGWNRIVDALQTNPDDLHLQQRLKEAESDRQAEFWEFAFEAIDDGIAVTDASGMLLKVNQAFLTSLNVTESPDQIVNQSLTMLPAIDTDELAEMLESTRRSSISEFLVDQRCLRLARIRVLDQSTSKSTFVWTLRDITQQKMSEKMHSQFVESATHELRTPLANIQAYAETLALTDLADVTQQKEFCNTICTEATRLSRFIDELLSERSLEAGSLTISLQTVDLERMFSEITEKIHPLLSGKQIEFDLKRPDKLPEASLDKDKIVTVLVNLLGNAGKYTDHGGSVKMKIEIESGSLSVAVTDSGFGISPEEQARVFDRFFRSDDPRVRNEIGTGLGLHLAKEIAELHGGSIDLYSVLNEGSTFTLTLPIGQSVAADEPQSTPELAAS